MATRPQCRCLPRMVSYGLIATFPLHWLSDGGDHLRLSDFMPRGEQLDLLLLHAPSVYDFRKMSIFYGPISDMIPSSTVFEMYPLGFLTIASYLQKQGMRVRIVNLAVRMMKDRSFSVPRFLASQHPRAIGIDLHWLPHAHGALEVAKIVKEIHPDVPVILGGLSSTYFHQELIGYPQVDYVLRGDSTEAPLYQLLLALRNGGVEWTPFLRQPVNP